MSEIILAEKYRPQTVNECILTDAVKKQVNDLIATGSVPTMLFTGGAGCGKTTLARAIANELEADILFINASMDANIDEIRTTMTKFASSRSFTGSKKITVLDEADGLTFLQQQALRGFIEKFGNNHSIIFTANYVNKIMEPIRSRCMHIDFKIPADQKQLVAAKFIKRLLGILKDENIEFDKAAVAELVLKKFPDFRSVMMTIQGYSAGGMIDSGILLTLSDEAFESLTASLKSRKFNDIRKWVAEHSDMDAEHFYTNFCRVAIQKLENKGLPELFLQLSDASYKDYFIVDKEIARMGFLVGLMLNADIVWK